MLAMAMQPLAVPAAHAQLSGRVSVESQYRVRGYAIAEANPVATATLSYDDQSGIYVNGTVIAGTHGSGAGVAGYQASAGYAARLTPSLSIDAGVVQTGYARIVGRELGLSYTEVYAGITSGKITARAYYSPNYFVAGRHTLYGEVQGNFRPLPALNVNLHVGALTYLSNPPRYAARTRLDWRATVSHGLGPFELHASLSGRGAGADYYARSRGRAVVTAGVALAF
jgi:uncharacterized protein (TIGR02001 family)